jgi:hypothetical protein
MLPLIQIEPNVFWRPGGRKLVVIPERHKLRSVVALSQDQGEAETRARIEMEMLIGGTLIDRRSQDDKPPTTTLANPQ